ncbi:beta-lactamase/transpeptidase-like protein [Melanomma pulvis-pyrius CBS 109.77]|uniref:Beta-lactamase/transpeptidase-like protein n=1 Tax=Melanomma pulvis-pyrius CBS 109.77 TaxID=1314802 RepID=A0A6A6XNY7_9PLEO|nr:beta-lactamase/transpeptidase-like protein [Melanomma pulvis-pyrius CBS 109.77]
MNVAEQIQRLNPTISRLLALSGSPRLSVGVLHCGAVVHTAHFGRHDVNHPTPPNDDTIYHIVSLVKLLTASSIAWLVHDGTLEWDTPIRDYLPEFGKRTDEIGQRATVRDLLSMRTGIAVSHASFGLQLGESLLARSETVRTACSLNAVAPFREQFIYSQWNYGLITDVVEEVTGNSFGTFVERTLLGRLKMDRTIFDTIQNENRGRNISKAHAVRNNGTACTIIEPGWTDESGFAGAGGCKASLHDLLRMYQSFLSACTHQEKNGVDYTPGSPWAHTRTILEPHVRIGSSDINNLSYCLGLYRSKLPANLSVASLNQQMLGAARVPIPQFGLNNGDLKVYHHTGAVPGFHASMFMVPSTESAVVILTNSIPLMDPTDFAAQLILSVLIGETPSEHKYLELAEIARPLQVVGYKRLAAALDKKKTGIPPPFALSKTNYMLLPYDGNTFYWKADREEELCEKAMWPFLSPDHHKITFAASTIGVIDSMTWFHDPLGSPEIFRKLCSDRAKM